MTDAGEASRLCRVGEATGERVSFLGDRLQAEYPVVAEALASGTIPVDSALWIVRNLAEATPPHSVDLYRTPRRGERLPVPAMTVRPPPWDTG